MVSWLQFLLMKYDDAIAQLAQLSKHYSMLYFNARRHESKALLRKYDQLAAVGCCFPPSAAEQHVHVCG